jgi:hypothetical protein
VGLSIKRGNNVAERRAKTRGKQKSLCSDNVTGGRRWHGQEIKLKNLKHEEGHIALGVK